MDMMQAKKFLVEAKQFLETKSTDVPETVRRVLMPENEAQIQQSIQELIVVLENLITSN